MSQLEVGPQKGKMRSLTFKKQNMKCCIATMEVGCFADIERHEMV